MINNLIIKQKSVEIDTEISYAAIEIRYRGEMYIKNNLPNNFIVRKGNNKIIILRFSKDDTINKDLFEYREKQEGVPFNYSLGGGTQGVVETNTIGGPDPKDENLIIQENFAGTFIGDISRFRLYECCLDITTIRYRFKKLCLNYGICPQELICYILSENGNIISSEDGEDFLIWCSE